MDLFSLNDKAIDFDFELVTKGRTSAPLSETNGIFRQQRRLIYRRCRNRICHA